MISEYQKEQQNKSAYTDITSGDEFKYVPSNINEPTIPYNLTNSPLGAPATENDVGNKSFEIEETLKNLKALDNEEIIKKEKKVNLEIYKIQLEEKEKDITNTLNEETTIDNEIKRLDAELATKQKLLDTAIRSNFSTVDKHQTDCDALNKNIQKENKKLKFILDSKSQLVQQLSEIQTHIYLQ